MSTPARRRSAHRPNEFQFGASRCRLGGGTLRRRHLEVADKASIHASARQLAKDLAGSIAKGAGLKVTIASRQETWVLTGGWPVGQPRPGSRG